MIISLLINNSFNLKNKKVLHLSQSKNSQLKQLKKETHQLDVKTQVASTALTNILSTNTPRLDDERADELSHCFADTPVILALPKCPTEMTRIRSVKRRGLDRTSISQQWSIDEMRRKTNRKNLK